jgi:hypothetical protein
MAIANPEMYHICYNPSIRGAEKMDLAPPWEPIDRQSFAALADPALYRISDNEPAVTDDWRLSSSDINTSSAYQ